MLRISLIKTVGNIFRSREVCWDELKMELTKLYLVVVLLGVILVDYTSAKSSSRRSEEEKKPKQGLTALNATSSDAENGKLAGNIEFY